jgi:CRP-like cAMP-binding protein/Fe-S-cluster-containing dehydrogenase component
MSPEQVQLTIDGRGVSAAPGTTIYEAARGLGIEIPTLCHSSHMTPVGVCRVCTVSVKGARVLAAACIRPIEPGMTVETGSDPVRRARRTVLELLLSDHPSPCARQRATGDCELEGMAARDGVGTPRFAARESTRPRDDSSEVIAVDHAACILCDRCIRGCDDVKHNFVIGRTGKGDSAGIAFDSDVPMGQSTCVACGECMVSCPTGALTNKKIVDVGLPAGDDVAAAELLDLPIFEGVSGTFLALNQGAVVRRKFRPGEIICREGEFGSTAFYVLRGKVEVFLSTPMAHAKSGSEASAGGIMNFFRRFTNLVGSHEDPRDEAPRRFIPIDASVDLAYDNPLVQLGAGELFGEMTCTSFYPRSATVRAVEETEVLEMLRNVLYILQRSKLFRATLERTYRARALDSHLRRVPVFASLTDDFLDRLREHVDLLRIEPGQVICRQGEMADSFYLVRIGFVKVTQNFPSGEMVVAYLGRGSYFGEIGLLGEGRRVATCTALDHVEVVRIRAEDFKAMVKQFPEIRQMLTNVARARLEANRERVEKVSTIPLDDFLDRGLMEAQSLLLIDLERCTRCDLCVRACAAAHEGVTRLVRDGLRFDKYLVATSCYSCRDPLCMVGCPVGAIRRRDSLEIMIEDWCIGCGLCAQQCPYGNINMHSFTIKGDEASGIGERRAVVKQKATTCDLSREYTAPACVVACPHDAAMRVEPLKFFAKELGTKKG